MIDDFQNSNTSYTLVSFWAFRLRLSYLDIGNRNITFVLYHRRPSLPRILINTKEKFNLLKSEPYMA